MRTLTSLFFILLHLSSKADKLELLFRFYGDQGKVSYQNMSVAVTNGKSQVITSPDRGGWQNWELEYSGNPIQLLISDGVDSLKLDINIHPNNKEVLRTLVINRLQSGELKEVMMVNQLTCKWTGSIAYPLENRFQNPLDGMELRLLTKSCLNKTDSAKINLQVLSDSVLLVKCSESEGYFVKYFLGSDKIFRTESNQVACQTSDHYLSQSLLNLLVNPENRLLFRLESNRFTLIESGCRWEFEVR